MSEVDDLTLVESARGGDAAAFNVLMERHQARIYHHALRLMGSSEDAEEVLQDAFLQAYRYLDRFEERSRFSTWIYRIATNEALMRLRKARRKREVFLEDNVAEDLQGDPLRMITGSDLSALVERNEPPVWPDGLVVQPSGQVLQTLPDDVGARPWDRDAIDTRIVNEALAGTGSHIDHESEGGGYPQHVPTSAAFDAAQWDACFKRIP